MNSFNASFPLTKKIYKNFKKFILKDFHPCVMARSVFSSEHVRVCVYDKMDQANTNERLLADLENYVKKAATPDNDFYSFIATFPEEQIQDEREFERKLWNQLSSLHHMDEQDWDATVSDDPDSKFFSFSLHGHAFYIVGMHPKSSRLARRAPYPTIVFNLHQQFEQLRSMNVYEKVRDRIRKRDKKLQGSINPMLKDFGTASEARQYSGRAVEKKWKCPFHRLFKANRA